MTYIPLTQGKYAIVDDEDYPLVSKYKWYACKGRFTWYAATKIYENGKWATQLMHRLILGLKPGDGEETDHTNRNGLDNQRCNIRVATRSQNMANIEKRHNEVGPYGLTSKYKGVSKNNKSRKWHVHISVNGKNIRLGSYYDEMMAAQVYDDAAKEYFGEFARCNFGEM